MTKHTECKDCELRNGDCGNHFKLEGVTNYDIPSLSACDRYGDCLFFKEKAKPQGDLISREALKKKFDEYIKANPNISGIFELGKFIIDNAPTVKSTVGVTIRDQFGNEIIGYEDQTRNLIFTGYGIITTELAQQKKYTIIENKEWRGAES